MRIFKSNPLLKIVNSYVIDSPQPSNLSYLWNFGSLLAFCLIIQIITGVTLAMHYNPSTLEAFNSVEHIMRDVNNGWLIRYLHSNTASAFFFLVYLHIGRGMYYGSYKTPRTIVWTIGTIIFILMMAIAFLGYIYGPTWFNLLKIILQYINDNLFILASIIGLIFQISLTIFYVNNFVLSSCQYTKYMQIFSFIMSVLVIAYLIIINMDMTQFILYIQDDQVNLHGHVNVTKEAAKELSKGMTAVGTQFGLGASIVGVGTAVGKAKSGIPPLQKASIIVAASALGGITHSTISAVNRKSSVQNSNDVNSNIHKFMDGSSFDTSKIFNYINDSVSPLQELLTNIQGIGMIYIVLLWVLCIQIIFKLYLKDNIKINLINLFGKDINNRLEYYINSIIHVNKNMSTLWIFITLIILFLSSVLLIYISGELINDLDCYVSTYIESKK